MPSFLHPSLFWTLGLPTLGVAAIPVLIHLINLMRHRRQPWAAMEFLLQSQKKNRRRVMFRQLILLLMRMAAVAAVVLLAAGPVLQSRWAGLMLGARTHHVVLLDDSYSMSDRWADTDAFVEAKKAVRRIAAESVHRGAGERMTLLRFSRAGGAGRAAEPDLFKQPLGGDFSDRLDELLAKLATSQTAAGPLGALRSIAQLAGDEGDHRVLYLISDFRSRQWDEPKDLREELRRAESSGAEIHLIDCVDRPRPNLAIVSLGPAEGVRGAGVPWPMRVVVQNFGPETVRDVLVALVEDGQARPSATLTEIAPGKTAEGRFLVNFPQPGRHTLAARLESDAVEADNHRYYATDVPADVPVLLIDGGDGPRDVKFLSLALAPGGAVRTGVRPQIESPRYLEQKPLDHFAAVYVAGLNRLDARGVESLERYVSSGGGAAFFLSPQADVKAINERMHRDGRGLFPMALAGPAELAVDRLDPAPDVQVEPAFYFRVFADAQNPLLQAVKVQKYFAVPEGRQPPKDSTVRVTARLRGGAPLVVERPYGRGRVAAFLTTAAPEWNTWARNPSFVVVIQDLLAHLSKRPQTELAALVGSPIELQLDPAVYRPEIQFIGPDKAELAAVQAQRGADGRLRAELAAEASGYCEARLLRVDGTEELRQLAVNVDPAEGDLSVFDPSQLADRLQGIRYRRHRAAEYPSGGGQPSGYHLSEALLLALVGLLIVEQLFAYQTSCHPPLRRATPGGGP